MTISVCIATYNGEKYIYEQIDSILPQLGKEDEIVISDDSSTDKTIEIIESFNDERIILLKEQTFNSHVYNFEHSLKQAKGEYIFLADQDDIWLPNKVTHMITLLETYDLVLSDAQMVNEKKEPLHDSFFKFNYSRKGFFKNLYKNSYLGCCMAFNRTLLNIALPFPKDINMHDWWIGLNAELYCSINFNEQKLIQYRRHPQAITPQNKQSTNSLFQKITFRLIMLKGLLLRYILKHLLKGKL